MRPSIAAAVALALAVSSLPAPRPALAQTEAADDAEAQDASDLEEAIRLSELGRLHYEGGEYAEAAEAFRRAFELHPDAVLGYNAGRSYENAGAYDAALGMYEATLALEADDEALMQRCSEGVTRIRNLLARVEREREEERLSEQAELNVVTEPPGATVVVDDEVVGQAPANVPLPAGRYDVRLEHPGHVTYQEAIELNPGQSLAMRVGLPELPPAETEPDAEADGGPVWWAVGLSGGIGVALIGLGAGAAIAAQNRYDEASTAGAQRDDDRFDDLIREGEDLKRGSTLLYGLGIGAVATAVLLYFVTDAGPDDDESDAQPPADVDVTLGPDGFGASVGFAF